MGHVVQGASEPALSLRASFGSAGPRNPPAARVTTSFLLAATMVVPLLSLALTDRRTPTLQLVAVVAVGGAALCLLKLPLLMAAPLCLLAPVVRVVVIVAAATVTGGAGVAGQVLFCLPVLFAATELKPGGAVLITATAAAGEAAVAASLLPHRQEVLEFVYVEMTLVTVALVLTRAGITQDRLIAVMRRQSAVDPITGLATRRVLDDAAASALSGADPQVGTALVLVDVDRFKTINDTYGHMVGDDALRHVARLLAGASRAQDVVARMGGDEFAVLMPGCRYNVAHQRAEEFVARVQDSPLRLHDESAVVLSISAGPGHYPGRHRGHPKHLYELADDALYAAKKAGRGRVGEAEGNGQSEASQAGLVAPETV